VEGEWGKGEFDDMAANESRVNTESQVIVINAFYLTLHTNKLHHRTVCYYTTHKIAIKLVKIEITAQI